MAAERLHGEDTTVPVLAKGKDDTGGLDLVCDDKQVSAAPGPDRCDLPLSRDRRGEIRGASRGARRGHPQADV